MHAKIQVINDIEMAIGVSFITGSKITPLFGVHFRHYLLPSVHTAG